MEYSKVTTKTYQCVLCGQETQIATNHTGNCFSHCRGCSWKSDGFGPGIRLGTGPIMREHKIKLAIQAKG